MEKRLDLKRFRKDLKDYYASAAMAGMADAMDSIIAIETADEDELFDYAEEIGVDPEDYMI